MKPHKPILPDLKDLYTYGKLFPKSNLLAILFTPTLLIPKSCMEACMLNFFKKKTKTINQMRAEIKEAFLASPHHQWISEDRYIKRAFIFLLDNLTEEGINFLHPNKNEAFFIKGNGRLGTALGAKKNTHLILVYPDLIKMLTSGAPLMGVAVLAHELGHIIKGHSFKIIDPLQAQCEADQVAFEMGLGNELQEVLMDQPSTIETKTRIARLTALILTNRQ